MKRTYSTGTENHPIHLAVTLATAGEAYTTVIQYRSGGQHLLLAESTSESGNIASVTIGRSQSLKQSYIVVKSIIDLSYLSETERQLEVKNLRAYYHFSGGEFGDQTYNVDIEDMFVTPNKKLIAIIKPIKML